MHAFRDQGYTIHHNGDFSGDAIITTSGGPEMTIPCSVLLGFVADAVRASRIDDLEQATPEKLLGIKLP